MSIRGQGHYLTLAKGHSACKIIFYFETVELLSTKFDLKVYGCMGMKIHTIELGYMTKMALMRIYGIHLITSSSPLPMDQSMLLNLICSIGLCLS